MWFRRRLVYGFITVLCFAALAAADDATLLVSPDSLFFRQLTSTAPAPLKFTVSGKGATLGAFTATATSTGNWLSISPASGSGTTTITASVNTTGLAAGQYSGTINVAAAGFRSASVRVQLEITPTTATPGTTAPAAPQSVLILRPDNLEFRTAQGGAAPPSRDLTIFNPAGDSFSWTATTLVNTPPAGRWLSVSPASGNGKGVLKVQVDPTGLSAGQYDGQVKVTSGANTATTRVSLTVGSAQSTNLVVVPQALNFNLEPNSKRGLQPRTLEVRSAGRSQSGGGPGGPGGGPGGPGGPPSTQWTASVAIDKPTGGNWLTITPSSGKTPDKIKVTANPTGLAAGTYSGKVIVKSGADTSNVLVFLRILGSQSAGATVAPKELRFNATTGTSGVVSPATRTININSTTTGLSFTATAATAKGGNWLKITPASGAVPGSITASVDASIATKLAPGFYTAAIEVKIPAAAKPVSTVHVGLKVFSPDEKPRLQVEPGGVAFSGTVGGADPAAKQVELQPEGAASLAWTATTTIATPTGGTWLSVSPTSGTTTAAAPSKVSVSVKLTGLVAGTYSGTVVFTPDPASGAPAVHLKVVLTVTTATAVRTALTASDELGAALAPGDLVAFFTSPADGFIADFAAPPVVSVTVLDSAGAAVEGATVRVSSSNTEPDFTLEDLGGGQYQGVFRALSSGSLSLTGSAELDTQSSAGFGVSGGMESSSDQPAIIFQNGAVSAASLAQGPVPLAPGSLISLFGKNIAGEGGAAGKVPLSTDLGGVSVTIGGIPAPLLAALPSQDQINLQVPFELQGQSAADIVINNNGVLSQPETVDIGVAPALFTASSSGTGAGAFLHGAGGPISASSPASAGEVILLFATGLGAVLPSVDTGNAATGLANVTSSVSVTIGGQNAPVQFAGLAPGFVGLYQINVQVPSGVSAGDALVVLSVDGIPATGQATVSVR